MVAAIYHAREVNDAMGVTGKGAPPMAGLSAEDRRALEFGLGVVRSQRDAYFGNRFMHISFNDGAVRFANIGDNGAVSNVQQATCF